MNERLLVKLGFGKKYGQVFQLFSGVDYEDDNVVDFVLFIVKSCAQYRRLKHAETY